MAQCNCKPYRGEDDGHLDSCAVYFNLNLDKWYYLLLDAVRENGVNSSKFLDINLNFILYLNKYYDGRELDFYRLVEEDIKKAKKYWEESLDTNKE